MQRLVTILTSLAANALSFGLAAALFDGFSVTPWWYVAAVIVFTAVAVVLSEVIAARAISLVRPSTLLGGLVLTWVGVLVTHLVVPGDGFHIDGWLTWVGVTVFVWAAGVAFGDVQQEAPARTPGISPEARAEQR